MWYGIAGVAFGMIGGMGMGGGVILIPVLTLLLGVGQHTAQGMNLMAFLPMSIFALIAHLKKHRVDVRLALVLCASGLVGALAGAWAVTCIDNSLLKRCV